jgi:hypothetical protein
VFGEGLVNALDHLNAPPSGGFLVDLATGVVTRIAPDFYFRDLVSTPGGEVLYGVEDWPRRRTIPLVRIDSRTGLILTERSLTPNPGTLVNEWNLAYAKIPVALLPTGETSVVGCRSRQTPIAPDKRVHHEAHEDHEEDPSFAFFMSLMAFMLKPS